MALHLQPHQPLIMRRPYHRPGCGVTPPYDRRTWKPWVKSRSELRRIPLVGFVAQEPVSLRSLRPGLQFLSCVPPLLCVLRKSLKKKKKQLVAKYRDLLLLEQNYLQHSLTHASSFTFQKNMAPSINVLDDALSPRHSSCSSKALLRVRSLPIGGHACIQASAK